MSNLFASSQEPESPAASSTAAPHHTQTLYRKYRPQSFQSDELVGQDHVVQTLRNAIMLDRVAHAYLFCGPRGTGKTTTARLLAKAVNCLDPDPANRPCNVCANCQAIARGAATDVIEIDAASNRGIDDIRDLRERVKYAPTQLKTKFYIIDEAHQITGPAANAFLKTLEEPPGHTKFVLATTDPEELLATIVSRCQRFDFRRIALEPMLARLRFIAAAENMTIDDAALTVIARHATGSLRDAEGLLDQLSVYHDETGAAEQTGITADLARALLGVSRNDRVEALVSALANRDPGAALGTVNAAIESGEDPRQLNRQLVAYLRVLLHERATGSPDADARARELAPKFELLELASLARRFNEIDYRIRHSSFSQLPLETALVEAILRDLSQTTIGTADPPAGRESVAPKPDQRSVPAEPVAEKPPTTALRDRLRNREAPMTPPSMSPPPRQIREQSPVSPVTPTSPSPPPAPMPISDAPTNGALTVGQLMELWPRIRQDVKAINRRIEALLMETDPAAMQGDKVILASAYEFHRNRLNTDEIRSVLEQVISRLLGRRVYVSAVLRGEHVPASSPGLPPEPAPVPAESVSHGEEPVSPNAERIDPVALPTSATRPEPNGTSSTAEDDAQRIQAAKNIFDAVEIEE